VLLPITALQTEKLQRDCAMPGLTIDLNTLIAIRHRMEAAAIPLLFHDTITPERQRARVMRILAWMGPSGREISRDYVMRREIVPKTNTKRFARGGMVQAPRKALSARDYIHADTLRRRGGTTGGAPK
jgi:hypothetical protein